MLSGLKQTPVWVQLCPHNADAITIGTSSLAAILTECQLSGHSNWNQPMLGENAPQPNVPDASETTSTEVVVTGKNDMSFQSCKNVCHHIKSALALVLRRT